MHLLVLLSVLSLLAVAAAIGLFYYVFAIPEPEGLSLASWPHLFTENFSLWMDQENGQLRVQEIGLARLEKYGLWLQVLDETGREVYSYQKPEHRPSFYPASELMQLANSPFKDGTTVFTGSFEASGQTWSYLIGFPYAIGKHLMYYNQENTGRLFPLARSVLLLAFVILFALVFGCGIWLSRKLSILTGAISDITLRTYRPLPPSGVFGQVCEALNIMDQEIRQSDRLKEETTRTRQEWIANISHDLKTPLSPIRGYAELLSGPLPDAPQPVQEYGRIILKNATHMEKLINDLKLTYQLEARALPCHLKCVRLVRYLRELLTDILNDPAFLGRIIEWEGEASEISVLIDPDLFRRVIQNLVSNALLHNPPPAKVSVSAVSLSGKVRIMIRDNGSGLNPEDLSGLFDRYYRGTSTKEKPEGTGLGLAIARQIVLLHGGDISVASEAGIGTEFTIYLPADMSYGEI